MTHILYVICHNMTHVLYVICHNMSHILYVICHNKTHMFSLWHIFSSEGALYVILPYDYPAAQQRTHFLNTHRSLITTLSIVAVMTLLTVISMKTKINKMTISDDNF